MSTDARDRTIGLDAEGTIDAGTFRVLALGCILVLTASYVSVLRDVTRVVGGTGTLLLLVVAMLVAATVLAETIRPRTAIGATAIVVLFGFWYYFSTAGVEIGIVLAELDELLTDVAALATGLPLLRMVAADVWALGFAPGPVFLSWYLALRGRYDLSVVPGGLALLFLVLTGDAETPVVLLGTLGAVGAIGFGELERRGGSIAQADLFAVLVAVIVVLSLSVTFVPGESSGPAFSGQADAGTLEGTIDFASQQSAIGGDVELSPEVRFTVESERPSYWRTGVYDRFTGEEWVRSGHDRGYNGNLGTPPGEYEAVTQRVTAETALGVMPTAPKPVAIEGEIAQSTTVSVHGQPRPEEQLREGDSYVVQSAVVERDPATLRTAGTDYPDHASDYLQLPESTSSQFEQQAAEVTGDAETPYDKAVAIESHLRSSKDYSLEVDRPEGNVADEFLFEMEEGYCVYFATTMVQMLRTEGIPARYVTGYTTGQQVDDDTYVVRGLDAHAWVEVYFPDHGWVAFDPTPGDAREEVHTDRLQQAREDGQENVDTDASEDVPIDDGEDDPETSDPSDENRNGTDPEMSDPDTTNGTTPNDTNGTDPPDGPSTNGTDGTGDDDPTVSVPITRETAALGMIVLIGVAAGAHRTSATARARRGLQFIWQRRRDDPNEDARIAYRRLDRLLAHRYRPRRRSESRRQYLTALRDEYDDLDPRTERVVRAYERATYGEGVDRETADAAIAIVDDLVRDRLPVLGDR
ncbi:transglutaminaseTgpA domain-containing protein [Halosolutus amylolyticus]|uniref:TransglutaminaseTgpA domain-containing protein n=1 Tax=Halosolutus amylolyticus TaxID=2932267 RepID=A0ABD5PRE8_9EURY|nr:transglutaminaseTgpA domain-containing protein [Halosolutus amylolyticus]